MQQTKKNSFCEIESIANKYRHEYLAGASDDDSVFFLVVFFEDSMNNKLLINANNVQIPRFLIRPSLGNTKNYESYKGYVESNKNFFFVYDLTSNTISQEYFNSVEIKTDLYRNKPLEKYNTDDFFLDSHTDIYNITQEFNIVKREKGMQ